MKVILDSLLDGAMHKFSPVNLCKRGEVFDCDNVRFWDGEADADSLYIAKVSEILQNPAETSDHKCIQIFVIEDRKIPDEYYGRNFLKTVKFPKDTDPLKLYNALNKEISFSRYALRLEQLVKFVSNGNFSAIADSIRNITGHSTAILSSGLRLIAMSEDTAAPENENWDLLVKNGIYPVYKMRAVLSGTRVILMVNPNDGHAYHVHEFPGDTGELFCPILLQKDQIETMGYIYCGRVSRIEAEKNMSVLIYICRLLVEMMRQFSVRSRQHDMMFSLTISRIIDGEITTNDEIKAQMAKLQFKSARHMILITIITRTVKDNETIHKLADKFMDLWPSAIMMFHDSHILILEGKEELPLLEQERLEQFQERLYENSCTAGISDVFSHLDRTFRNHYYRTLCAAVVTTVMDTRRNYAFYKEIALKNAVIDTIDAHSIRKNRNLLIDPKLMELVDYDKSHKTDYLLTLRYYWNLNRNSEEICKLLHIQKSTLFYRLGKVREFLDQDYNDYHSLTQLSLGIAMLEVKGEIAPLDLPVNIPNPGKKQPETNIPQQS